jgi:hypothetical protein
LSFSKVLVELHFFPCIAYFVYMHRAELFIIEQHENFQKQSYRNRCFILGANKVQPLTVPVEKGRKRLPVRDVKIDYTQNWQNEHWHTLQSAYGKSPFYDYFKEEFTKIYARQPVFLWDLNWAILTKCRELLQLQDKVLVLSEQFEKRPQKEINDLRSSLTARMSSFQENLPGASPYVQVFGNKFVKNLSVIDVLFCQGIGAKSVIMQSGV